MQHEFSGPLFEIFQRVTRWEEDTALKPKQLGLTTQPAGVSLTGNPFLFQLILTFDLHVQEEEFSTSISQILDWTTLQNKVTGRICPGCSVNWCMSRVLSLLWVQCCLMTFNTRPNPPFSVFHLSLSLCTASGGWGRPLLGATRLISSQSGLIHQWVMKVELVIKPKRELQKIERLFYQSRNTKFGETLCWFLLRVF